jgi:hypothetical protein
MGLLYMNIGITYCNLTNYNLAQKYLNKSLKIY